MRDNETACALLDAQCGVNEMAVVATCAMQQKAREFLERYDGVFEETPRVVRGTQ
jgi:hypothetical protein